AGLVVVPATEGVRTELVDAELAQPIVAAEVVEVVGTPVVVVVGARAVGVLEGEGDQAEGRGQRLPPQPRAPPARCAAPCAGPARWSPPPTRPPPGPTPSGCRCATSRACRCPPGRCWCSRWWFGTTR